MPDNYLPGSAEFNQEKEFIASRQVGNQCLAVTILMFGRALITRGDNWEALYESWQYDSLAEALAAFEAWDSLTQPKPPGRFTYYWSVSTGRIRAATNHQPDPEETV